MSTQDSRHAIGCANTIMTAHGGADPETTMGIPDATCTASSPSTSRQSMDPMLPLIAPTAAITAPEQERQVTSDAQRNRALLLWDPLLQTLASGLDDIESVRIAQANRFRILTTAEPDSDGETRGFGLDASHPSVAALAAQMQTLEFLEAQMTKALQKQLKTHALHPWIKAQRGLGDKQVARLLAAIRDPYWNDLHDRPRTVSELWAFCGLHVLPVSHKNVESQEGDADGTPFRSNPDQRKSDNQASYVGVAPTRRRGQKCNWSQEARTRIYVIAESCMKQRQSPYRAVYDAGREKYADAIHNTPCAQCGPKGSPAQPGSELRDGHKHARAMRLVMKAVLKDLWLESKRIYAETEAKAA